MPFSSEIAGALRGLSGQFELGRLLWAAFSFALIAYQGIDTFVNKQPFSPVNFGIGAAGILAAGGFGIRQKDTGVAKAQTEAGNVQSAD